MAIFAKTENDKVLYFSNHFQLFWALFKAIAYTCFRKFLSYCLGLELWICPSIYNHYVWSHCIVKQLEHWDNHKNGDVLNSWQIAKLSNKDAMLSALFEGAVQKKKEMVEFLIWNMKQI